MPPGNPLTGLACSAMEELVMDNADDHAEKTGDALMLSEFGATDDLRALGRIVEGADDHMVSWQEWHYCDCRDPTTSGPGVQSLVIDPERPPRGSNVKHAKLAVLARPYPQAVAGTPRRYGFDPDSRRFELRYSTARAGGGRLQARAAHRGVPPAGAVPGREVPRRGERGARALGDACSPAGPARVRRESGTCRSRSPPATAHRETGCGQ